MLQNSRQVLTAGILLLSLYVTGGAGAPMPGTVTDPHGKGPDPHLPAQSLLRTLWKHYEEQGAPRSRDAVIKEEHFTPDVHQIEAKCGHTHFLGDAERYSVKFRGESMPCLYSFKLVQTRSAVTSIVCSGLEDQRSLPRHSATSAQCRGLIHVHRVHNTTNIRCDDKEVMSVPHPTPRDEAPQSTLTFIQCAFIVEHEPSTGDVWPAENVSQVTEQFCPNKCGVSRPTGMQANARIVGGTEAAPGEFPWQMLVVSRGSSHRTGVCGGSLLNAGFVLSAAHCFKQKTWTDVVYVTVVAGLHDIDRRNDSSVQMMAVKRIVVHPDYHFSPNVQNDIAVLQLARDLTFTPSVGPVCLADPGVNYVGREAVVTGFGIKTMSGISTVDGEAPNGHLAHTLMKADMKILEAWECLVAYAFYGVQVNSTKQICTRGIFQDSCKGDSGGPIVVKDSQTETYTQVGIVSFGVGCGSLSSPSVNTRVASYRQWIASIAGAGRCA